MVDDFFARKTATLALLRSTRVTISGFQWGSAAIPTPAEVLLFGQNSDASSLFAKMVGYVSYQLHRGHTPIAIAASVVFQLLNFTPTPFSILTSEDLAWLIRSVFRENAIISE